MTDPAKLGLDDLDVGQIFDCGTHLVSTEEIKRYAAEFDPQPFHMDEAAAEKTFFKGLAASGWHTAAITMRRLVEGMPLKGGIIGSGGELLWHKPVRPGDTLAVTCEILSITPNRSNPDRAAILVRVETRNAEGELVQSFAPKLLVTR